MVLSFLYFAFQRLILEVLRIKITAYGLTDIVIVGTLTDALLDLSEPYRVSFKFESSGNVEGEDELQALIGRSKRRQVTL